MLRSVPKDMVSASLTPTEHAARHETEETWGSIRKPDGKQQWNGYLFRLTESIPCSSDMSGGGGAAGGKVAGASGLMLRAHLPSRDLTHR